MPLLTVEQAAARLNRTPRTIRRWIEEQKLTGYHPPHGHTSKFLVESSEVERLAQELAQYEPGHKQKPAEDVTSLVKEVEQLRRELVSLKTDVAALEQLYYKLQRPIPAAADIETSPSPLQKQSQPSESVTQAEIPQEIPSGSIPYAQFAAQHGINERTARDQIDKGYISSYVRTRPSNPRFKERWLRPEDQAAAIVFWQSHETRGFRTCPECPHML